LFRYDGPDTLALDGNTRRFLEKTSPGQAWNEAQGYIDESYVEGLLIIFVDYKFIYWIGFI